MSIGKERCAVAVVSIIIVVVVLNSSLSLGPSVNFQTTCCERKRLSTGAAGGWGVKESQKI